MTRIVYVNGRYVPYAQAAVHVEDRGFQFADAVYEVIEVFDGALIDAPRHLERLARSLAALDIAPPMSGTALGLVMRQVIRRNRVRDGLVYLQVTRGAAPRDFPFPAPDTPPTVVCLAQSIDRAGREAQADKGIAVITVPDIRWGRCDIKTVMLLPAVLAKSQARAAGAKEAWLVDEQGFVTEGAASNAWIIDADGHLVTRRADHGILAGVTRATVIDCIEREGLEIVERPFRPEEVQVAREAFITAATNTVMPVVSIDAHVIGNGMPGPVTLRLREIFHTAATRSPAGLF